MLIETGRGFGLKALRIPAEPPALMQACGVAQSFASRALYRWCSLLRRQGRSAGLRMNDWTLGLAWSGAMTADKLLLATPHLPPGLGEIYFHPATARTPELAALMENYDHVGELAALLDPRVRAALGGRLRGWC